MVQVGQKSLDFTLEACFFDILKKTQGQKNSKLKEETE